LSFDAKEGCAKMNYRVNKRRRSLVAGDVGIAAVNALPRFARGQPAKIPLAVVVGLTGCAWGLPLADAV